MKAHALSLAALALLASGCGGAGSTTGSSSPTPDDSTRPSPLPVNANMPSTVEDTATVIGCELGRATTSGSVSVRSCLNSDHGTSVYQLTAPRKRAYGQLRMALSDDSTWFVVSDLGGVIAVGGSDPVEVTAARKALGIAVSHVNLVRPSLSRVPQHLLPSPRHFPSVRLR